MNDKLDPQNESSSLAHQTYDEGNQAGWPGDGSGTDDLADYNQNEANDYSNE
jgi:hypothetical protein